MFPAESWFNATKSGFVTMVSTWAGMEIKSTLRNSGDFAKHHMAKCVCIYGTVN